MKRITPLYLFESAEKNLSQEAEDFLNQCVTGSWEYDPLRKTVSVQGDFDCSYQDLEDLKGIKFSMVSGNFDCSDNDLKDLRGCPDSVGKGFDCSSNLLTSLEYGPSEVGGSYYCSGNKLTSLKGAPEEVSGRFDCSHNKLETLNGCPTVVGKTFDCSYNKLQNLEGGLEYAKKNYICSHNKISSFAGFPKFVQGIFDFSSNSLESFNGFPTFTEGDLVCSNNKINSILGIVSPRSGTVKLEGNPLGIKHKSLFDQVLQFMRKTGMKVEDAILLRGLSLPAGHSSTSMATGAVFTPPSNSWDKIDEKQRISNIKDLMDLVSSPKEAYSLIQKNPEGFAITAFIKDKMPDVWDRMKDVGRAKLSAEMGDLFF